MKAKQILRQDVALTDQGQHMSDEFYRMLIRCFDNYALDEASTGYVTLAAFKAQAALLNTLQTQVNDLTQRVVKLEKGGYQS